MSRFTLQDKSYCIQVLSNRYCYCSKDDYFVNLPFSISIWYYAKTMPPPGQDLYILSKFNTVNTKGFYLRLTQHPYFQWVFNVDNVNYIVNFFVPKISSFPKWFHIVAVVNPSDPKIYVNTNSYNGSRAGTITNITNSNEIWVGRIDGVYGNGSVCCLKYFDNQALTLEQVQREYRIGDLTPTSCWRFDTGSGTTEIDQQGVVNMTLSNTDQWNNLILPPNYGTRIASGTRTNVSGRSAVSGRSTI